MESHDMSTQKRERDLARAKYERQQAKRADRARHAKRNQRITAIVVVIALVVAGVGFAVFNATANDPAVLTQEDQNSLDPTLADAGTEAVALDCSPAGTPRTNDITYLDGPVPLGSTPTTLTLETNCGQIVIALDANAPQTVESESFLADSGFYDSTSCHRLTTEGIYVLQCGDPAGDGTGGPGYAVPDENLPAQGDANYPAGTIAMANAGPGTSGSQFFIVYADTTLPGDYSIWGKVTSGLDIVQEVASVGVKGGLTDGVPAQPMFINMATVS
jgi:peptidyl-prolyl cis-trans isomerase B (cyclophilin B)